MFNGGSPYGLQSKWKLCAVGFMQVPLLVYNNHINNEKHVHHGFLAPRPYLCSTSLNVRWQHLPICDSEKILNFIPLENLSWIIFSIISQWDWKTNAANSSWNSDSILLMRWESDCLQWCSTRVLALHGLQISIAHWLTAWSTAIIDNHHQSLLYAVCFYEPCQNPFVTKLARTWCGTSLRKAVESSGYSPGNLSPNNCRPSLREYTDHVMWDPLIM